MDRSVDASAGRARANAVRIRRGWAKLDPAGSAAAKGALQLLRREPRLYAVLDAARDGAVLDLLRRAADQRASLYEGASPEIERVGPFLVALPPESQLLEMLAIEAWGKSWGIFLRSETPFAEVRRHLRRFLTVALEDGKEYYFRFYDPRVLRHFLPSCTPEELAQFFGPIESIFGEDRDGAALLQFSAAAEVVVHPLVSGS